MSLNGASQSKSTNTADNQMFVFEEFLRRNMDKLRFELGPVICDALDDPNVIEIMVNPPDGKIWLDYIASGMEYTGHKVKEAQILAGIGTIAAMLKMEVNAKVPILEAELPIGGARVEATVPPVSQSPGITIRKHASAVFGIDKYVSEKRISPNGRDFLKNALKKRKNILIVGGTGSGKTTFVNSLLALLKEVSPRDRVLLLEDTRELQSEMENVYSMCTTTRLAGKNEITMQTLVRTALRQRPDRIIVGEVRSGVALDLLKSWNTGHPGGISTVHANSAASSLIRLEQLISEVSVSAMETLIGEAVDVVVYLKRIARFGPCVTEIMEVKGYDAHQKKYDCAIFEQLKI